MFRLRAGGNIFIKDDFLLLVDTNEEKISTILHSCNKVHYVKWVKLGGIANLIA